MGKKEEITKKIQNIREVMEKRGLGAILITQQYNVSWLTAGANNHVLWDDQNSLIGILIREDDAIILSENGDFQRIQDEEFTDYPFEFKKIPWYGQGLGFESAKLISGKAGLDAPVAGIEDQVVIAGELSRLRAVLVEGEIQRFRENAKEASKIITEVAKETASGIRESDIAAMYAKACIEKGFSISVVLIGGDSRSLEYRHQVVTDYKVKDHYSFVGVGRKDGLVFPICRTISFGEPSKELFENHNKIEKVYVHLNSLAGIGVNLGEIFEKLPEVYHSSGLDPDEWRNHTQGGITAYLPREFVLCESADYVLVKNNVVGWNPAIPGVMAEDLYLLGQDGLEFCTIDDGWPREEVKANGRIESRPSILEI